VYEDGSKVATTADRIADDDAIYDLSCVTKNVPTANCQGRNYALQRAQYRFALLKCLFFKNSTDTKIFNAVVRHVWIIINHLMPLLTVGIL
jgi:hypothetical protein